MQLRLPRFRFSLLGLMARVAYAALACAALRYSTETWASSIFTLAILSQMIAVLCVVLLRGQSRAAWIGFLVFGGGYLFLSSGPWPQADLITNRGLDLVEPESATSRYTRASCRGRGVRSVSHEHRAALGCHDRPQPDTRRAAPVSAHRPRAVFAAVRPDRGADRFLAVFRRQEECGVVESCHSAFRTPHSAFCSQQPLDDLHEAVFVVRGRDAIGGGLHLRQGVAHGDAQAGAADHGNVVHVVADGADLLVGDAPLVGQPLDAGPLAHAAGADLAHEAPVARTAQHVHVKLLGQLPLQLRRQHEHLLARADGEAGEDALRRIVHQRRARAARSRD